MLSKSNFEIGIKKISDNVLTSSATELQQVYILNEIKLVVLNYKMNQMTNAQIQQFKKRFEQGEIDIPKPKWALSRKEAIAAKIPPHNSDYFEVSHLIKLTPLNSVIERLAPFYQKHLLNDNLFTPELNDRKIYRLYQLWKSNQPVTPPVIRAFPSNGFLPDIEILEGNHRIKLCLMNKVKSIPILVEHRLSMEIDPFKNSWFKRAKQ